MSSRAPFDYPIDFGSLEPPHAPRLAVGESRTFWVSGRIWLVCEAQSRVGRALFFLGPGVMRRVSRYPSRWMELSDEALYSLSWSS